MTASLFQDNWMAPTWQPQGHHGWQAPKAAWALPRFWVSIRSYKKQLVKKFGVEYWALPGSNSPWRPWIAAASKQVKPLRDIHKMKKSIFFHEIYKNANWFGSTLSVDVNQRGERQQLQSCHRCGPKTVPAQTAEITKCHVIFVVFFKF